MALYHNCIFSCNISHCGVGVLFEKDNKDPKRHYGTTAILLLLLFYIFAFNTTFILRKGNKYGDDKEM